MADENTNVCKAGLVEAGKKLYSLGYVAATDGNISVRLSDGSILTTPTGMSKGSMLAEDMVTVSSEGKKLSGGREPSSEIAMHLLIYRKRPDINAVVHAHPPTATGYAAAGIPLTKPLISEVVLTLGTIPLAPYGTPGTLEVTRSLEDFVATHDAVLMANHGAVTFAETLEKAVWKMETVEHFAQISLITEVLGKQSLLTSSDVQKLHTAREKYFSRACPSGRSPVCPIAAAEQAEINTRELVEAIVREILRARALK